MIFLSCWRSSYEPHGRLKGGIFYIELFPWAIGAGVLTNSAKLGGYAIKNPKATETFIAGSISTGYDIYNGTVSYEKTLANYTLAGMSAGRTWGQQLSINTIYNGLILANDKELSDKEIAKEGASKTTGMIVSLGLDFALKNKSLSSVERQSITNIIGGYIEIKTNKSSILNKDSKERLQ
ncbi:hypothetical protein OA57_11645 [Chelonobacter oris]|uniref:Uncharacterized protein n=1 Tax=Chelonobacter oris TaxID=505317 RepID=A0A0A3AJ44_9PAST|nr:hypothetical protein [Chelonobacter oris]KGQ69423.1 hypothetical protein OA57_11645 [Chelonobacter oris]